MTGFCSLVLLYILCSEGKKLWDILPNFPLLVEYLTIL